MNGATRFERALAVLRITLGVGFLWAGLEKVLQFGGAAPFSAAGFLKGATLGAIPGSTTGQVVNPTHDFWVGLAANATAVGAINFLVQFGEVAIGVALILGLATRFAGVAGFLMMGLFWVAQMSFATGPFNNQFMYAAIAAVLVYTGAGEHYGIDELIERLPFVKRHSSLKLVLE